MGELKQRLVAAHKLSQFLNGQSVGLSIRFIAWIFVAFTVEKLKIYWNDEFWCRIQIFLFLLRSPSLWSSGTSRVRGTYLFMGRYLARCRPKAFAIFVVLLGIVKRVFLGHCVWMFCCGYGHGVSSISLWGRGLGRCRESPYMCWLCGACSCRLPSGKSELILAVLSLHQACFKILFLPRWSLQPAHCFSGKRTYWKTGLWMEVKVYKGESFWCFLFYSLR